LQNFAILAFREHLEYRSSAEVLRWPDGHERNAARLELSLQKLSYGD
jgi:hypothetical protein